MSGTIPEFADALGQQKKRAFTLQEDERLIELVSMFGSTNWRVIASHLPGRSQRQCRERYKTYLAPGICHDPWTPEEDQLLREKFDEFGPKWAIISKFFRGRSDNNIKNRYNNHISNNRIKNRRSSSDDSQPSEKKESYQIPSIWAFDQIRYQNNVQKNLVFPNMCGTALFAHQ